MLNSTTLIPGRIREVIPLFKSICPKVNVIARLEFEIAYYDSAVQRINHYTTKTHPYFLGKKEEKYLFGDKIIQNCASKISQEV